jgi:hypothetical protein
MNDSKSANEYNSDSKSEKLPLSVTGKYAPSYSENRNAPTDKDTNDHGTNKQK